MKKPNMRRRARSRSRLNDKHKTSLIDEHIPTTEQTQHTASYSLSTTISSGQMSSVFSHEDYRHNRYLESKSKAGAVRAEWRPWPQRLLTPLRIVHNLCSYDDDSDINSNRNNLLGGWIPALHAAVDSYANAIPALTTTVEADTCQPTPNANLTFVDNVLHVVYGTCGADCCGKTDVEYKYRHDAQGNVVITRYSGLIRLDPSCFAASASDGTNNNDVSQKKPNKNAVNRAKQYLVCHELGHALTLGHNSDNPRSCMGDYDPNLGNYLPGKDDLGMINGEIYPSSPDSMGEAKRSKGGEESLLRTNDIILIEPRDSSFEESRGDVVDWDGSNRAGPWQNVAHDMDYSYISVGEEEGEMGRISGAGIAIVCLSLVTLLALLVSAFLLYRQRRMKRTLDLRGKENGRSKTAETIKTSTIDEGISEDDDTFNDNA